jgi:predicted MPP superfamily phosphohydrolase
LWAERTITPALLKAGLHATGLYARGLNNALSLVVRTLRVTFPGLPSALEGFQILHLSDFHIDGNEPLTARSVATLERLEPDLCVFTGDYRFDMVGACDAVYPQMRAIISSISAKYGIFGILGNHDAAEIACALEELGVRMLVNEGVEVRERGASLWLAGIDDPFDYRCDDLPASLAAAPSDAFKILLAHTPDLYIEAADRGVDLYLCGHTHAGQIRFPWIGSLRHNSYAPREYSYGHWTRKQMHGYTTSGLGCSSLPVRFNCPPEIVLIELSAI